MSLPMACILCSIDPGAANLMLPMAQATVIAAPILLRDQLKRGARAVTGRLRDAPSVDTDAVGSDDAGSNADALEDTEPI